MTASALDLGVTLRPMREGDLPFLVSTMVHGTRAPSWWSAGAGAWQDNARKMARAILSRSRVVVLCASDIASSVEGWAAGGDGYVAALYLRPSYAKHDARIARALTEILIRHARGDL